MLLIQYLAPAVYNWGIIITVAWLVGIQGLYFIRSSTIETRDADKIPEQQAERSLHHGLSPLSNAKTIHPFTNCRIYHTICRLYKFVVSPGLALSKNRTYEEATMPQAVQLTWTDMASMYKHLMEQVAEAPASKGVWVPRSPGRTYFWFLPVWDLVITNTDYWKN